MQETQRYRLLQRRRMLQLRLERQEHTRQFRGIAPALHARGLRFRKLLAASLSPWLAVTARLPGRDERIDWPLVPDCSCHAWQDASECARQLERALLACAGLEGRVLVVFNPFEAALVIHARDLVAAWPDIHDALYESTWIVPCDRRPWLIEVSPSDRELCYAAEVP